MVRLTVTPLLSVKLQDSEIMMVASDTLTLNLFSIKEIIASSRSFGVTTIFSSMRLVGWLFSTI